MRPEHEVNHSPPSNAVIEIEWSYISALPIRFNSMDRDNFTFEIVALLGFYTA
jgi:hypothetical protein